MCHFITHEKLAWLNRRFGCCWLRVGGPMAWNAPVLVGLRDVTPGCYPDLKRGVFLCRDEPVLVRRYWCRTTHRGRHLHQSVSSGHVVDHARLPHAVCRWPDSAAGLRGQRPNTPPPIRTTGSLCCSHCASLSFLSSSPTNAHAKWPIASSVPVITIGRSWGMTPKAACQTVTPAMTEPMPNTSH